MGFFFSQGKPEKPGNVMDFFTKARKFFKLIILISYLPIIVLDKSQDSGKSVTEITCV